MVEKTDEELMYATESDWNFYNRCIQGLPTRGGVNGDKLDKYGIEIPYGSSPHITKHFVKVVELINPKRILEIGFNCGWGAALWLNICDAELTSVDISDKDETVNAAKYLEEKYNPRFNFKFRKDCADLLKDTYDLIFIDGDHRESFIVEDIELAKQLNIPYILFDDCYERFGETMAAIKHFPELELVHDMDNIKLYTCPKH